MWAADQYLNFHPVEDFCVFVQSSALLHFVSKKMILTGILIKGFT